MVDSAPKRKTQAVHEHDARGRSPDHDPEKPGQRMPDERDAVSQLVGEGEGDRQVGVKVHRPPGLIAQPRAGGSERGHAGHHQKAERHGRHEHVRVGGEQDGELVPRADRRLLGVADRDEHGVRAQQDDGPRAETAMPPHEAVLAENTFQPGKPRYQQEHDEKQVAARQAGDLAGRGREPTRRGESPSRHGGQPEPERYAESEGGHCRDHVGDPGMPSAS